MEKGGGEIELQKKKGEIKKKARYRKEKKKKSKERKTLVCGKRLNAIAFSVPERARRGDEGSGGARNEDRDRWSKTITYPSCPPGAHFHPSERGKESHRLRYANYPP